MNARLSPGTTAMLTLVAMFVAGVAVGLAARRFSSQPPRRASVVAADMTDVLDKLDLTPQQRAAADAIVQRRAPRTEAMMLEVATKLRAVSDSLDAELRALLTPAQRARLDSLGSERTLILRRKSSGPSGETIVDTVFPRRDSSRR